MLLNFINILKTNPKATTEDLAESLLSTAECSMLPPDRNGSDPDSCQWCDEDGEDDFDDEQAKLGT